MTFRISPMTILKVTLLLKMGLIWYYMQIVYVKQITGGTQYKAPFYTTYLLENPTLCSSVQNLSVIVIVHTAPRHVQRRDVIRTTWTNDMYFRRLGHVRVLFLLGKVNDADVQHTIKQEFEQHGDILQGDFIDDYHNLTHKGVMAYKWLSERCRNAKVVLKTDDDVIVNTYVILTDYMHNITMSSTNVYCYVFDEAKVLRVKNSKWYVDEREYEGEFYPPYCGGFTVLFNNDVIPEAYSAALVTSFLWVDDAFLYGLVLRNIPGIKMNRLPYYRNVRLSDVRALACYEEGDTCNMLVGGANDPGTAAKLWPLMTNAYKRNVHVEY